MDKTGYNPKRPKVCCDESSKQLIEESRTRPLFSANRVRLSGPAPPAGRMELMRIKKKYEEHDGGGTEGAGGVRLMAVQAQGRMR